MEKIHKRSGYWARSSSDLCIRINSGVFGHNLTLTSTQTRHKLILIHCLLRLVQLNFSVTYYHILDWQSRVTYFFEYIFCGPRRTSVLQNMVRMTWVMGVYTNLDSFKLRYISDIAVWTEELIGQMMCKFRRETVLTCSRCHEFDALMVSASYQEYIAPRFDNSKIGHQQRAVTDISREKIPTWVSKDPCRARQADFCNRRYIDVMVPRWRPDKHRANIKLRIAAFGVPFNVHGLLWTGAWEKNFDAVWTQLYVN